MGANSSYFYSIPHILGTSWALGLLLQLLLKYKTKMKWNAISPTWKYFIFLFGTINNVRSITTLARGFILTFSTQKLLLLPSNQRRVIETLHAETDNTKIQKSSLTVFPEEQRTLMSSSSTSATSPSTQASSESSSQTIDPTPKLTKATYTHVQQLNNHSNKEHSKTI